jgi:hypothetical protein
MLHVDVDVPYVESFMGLTSSLRLGVEHGGIESYPLVTCMDMENHHV